MSHTTQTKFERELERAVEAVGLEMLNDRQFGNRGVIRVQQTDDFRTLVRIEYDFQTGGPEESAHLRIAPVLYAFGPDVNDPGLTVVKCHGSFNQLSDAIAAVVARAVEVCPLMPYCTRADAHPMSECPDYHDPVLEEGDRRCRTCNLLPEEHRDPGWEDLGPVVDDAGNPTATTLRMLRGAIDRALRNEDGIDHRNAWKDRAPARAATPAALFPDGRVVTCPHCGGRMAATDAIAHVRS